MCFEMDSLIENSQRVYVCYDTDIAYDDEDDMYCISDVIEDMMCDFPNTEFIIPEPCSNDQRHDMISSCDMVLVMDLFCKSKVILSDILYAFDRGICIAHKKTIC